MYRSGFQAMPGAGAPGNGWISQTGPCAHTLRAAILGASDVFGQSLALCPSVKIQCAQVAPGQGLTYPRACATT